MAECQKALETDPKSLMPHNGLGNALGSLGRLDEAMANFRRPWKPTRNCMTAHHNLANALSSKGRTDEAIAEYHKALKIDPKFVIARNNLRNIFRASRGFQLERRSLSFARLWKPIRTSR